MKGEYHDKLAKLMQANINPTTYEFELRFQLSMNGIDLGWWVCNEHVYHAMIASGDLTPLSDIPIVDLTDEHFDDTLFTL